MEQLSRWEVLYHIKRGEILFHAIYIESMGS